MTTVYESLHAGLQRAMADDPKVVLLGEDILDPYGGAFKVTRGLSTQFPERVLTTPISEAGITGAAAGMALRGLKPVVEIMFGDFVTLIADSLINHAAKFHWMYNGQVDVPLVIRTPMGGRRGYGPTHSQTLEKIYLGTPGLRVLAPTTLGDPGELLYQAIVHDPGPVFFVENKLLYGLAVQEEGPGQELDIRVERPASGYAPTYRLALKGAPPPQVTLAAYGYMAELARQAVLRLAYEQEVFVEVVVPTRLAPCDHLEPIFRSAAQTGRLLAVEEGTRALGWGAEVLAQAAEQPNLSLKAAQRLAALDLPVPASGPLEQAILPGVDELVQQIEKMV